MSSSIQRTVGIGSLVLVGLATLAGLAYLLIPDAADVAEGLDVAGAGEAVEVSAADVEGEAIPLDAENTSVGFACAKTIAGKTSIVRGGWSGKFDSQLNGTIYADPELSEVTQIRAEIEVPSLWSEHDDLTNSLLTQGFFKAEEHPTATFISTDIQPADSAETAMEGATHRVTGNFTLNGITKSISFPAKVELLDERLKVDSEFSLERHAFDVRFADGAGFGLLTDENIAERVAITLTIDAPLPGEAPTLAKTDVEPEAPIVEPEQQAAQALATLPSEFTETIPATQIDFKMVLVPGDESAGITPFYIGRHEVTWDEFMPWVTGQDLGEDGAKIAEQRAMKLRPSAPYGSVDRNFGMYKRPALSMSRLSAELYCKWLSEQTGRHYRLPTEAEWELAYTLGGGDPSVPLTSEQAEAQAVYADNSWSDSIGDWATRQVGQTEPNGLGIYDMAGNVAEWVTGTGEDKVARGGHFDAPREELGVGRYIEDNEVWNRGYPNDPKSIWWYVDARWVGFRVVCDTPIASAKASN